MLTIRQQIMDALFDKLANLKKHDDPTSAVFNTVGRFELGDIEPSELPAATLYEGEENIFDNTNNYITRVVTVFVDFSFLPEEGVDVYTKYNYYLGELVYGLLREKKLGDGPRYLNYDIQERGNTPRISDRNDDMPGGVLILDIFYRIGNYNPYSNNPNT